MTPKRLVTGLHEVVLETLWNCSRADETKLFVF